MVFHGDYEIEFEIHKELKDSWRTDRLGHMVGMTAQEALERWVAQHHPLSTELESLRAIPVISSGKV